MKTRNIFCANDQEVTEQEVTVDRNGEFLLTCPCGRFLKLAGDLDKDEIDAVLEVHEEANKGQVTQAEIEQANAEKLELI